MSTSSSEDSYLRSSCIFLILRCLSLSSVTSLINFFLRLFSGGIMR